MIDIDDLVGVGEAVEIGPHGRVIEARPAMHDEQRRPLHHLVVGERKLRPRAVEEDARAIDLDMHDRDPCWAPG